MRHDAELGVVAHRLPRIDGVDRATGARARCHGCREMIVKGEWRIPLVFYAEGAFNRRGFVHVRCGADYFGTADFFERLRRFAPPLDARDLDGIRAAMTSAGRDG